MGSGPVVAYTVPTGKRATVVATALIVKLDSDQNLRFRAGGKLQLQRGIGETITEASPVFISYGTFNLMSGEQISCSTQNDATGGGIIYLNASVLSEIPE